MTRQDRNCEVVKEICHQFSSLRKPLRQLSAHRYIVHWTFPLCILRVPDGTSSCSFFLGRIRGFRWDGDCFFDAARLHSEGLAKRGVRQLPGQLAGVALGKCAAVLSVLPTPP